MSWLALDVVLVAILVGLAWAALASPDARRSVVLFIAFGLLLALVWARLRAPDVALAEAAIGAGISGALLLAALRDEPPDAERPPETPRRSAAAAIAVLSLGLAAAVAWALVAALAAGSPGLSGVVAAELEHSGVSNPVTAVLLNFRAYDTLLELAVLLVAMLGVMALGPASAAPRPAGSVLAGLASWLVPALVIVGGYLLWVGGHAPGGAFQAGALLAGAGVIVRLIGLPSAGLPPGLWLRAATAGGVGVFLAVGMGLLLAGRPFLGYPSAWAGALILAIESAATLAIVAALVVTYLGGRPGQWASGPERDGQ